MQLPKKVASFPELDQDDENEDSEKEDSENEDDDSYDTEEEKAWSGIYAIRKGLSSRKGLMGDGFLHTWLSVTYPLPPFALGSTFQAEIADEGFSVWLQVSRRYRAHKILDQPRQSLRIAVKANSDYVAKAQALCPDAKFDRELLSAENRKLILSELGNPPSYCLCLYFFAVMQDEEERIVYVGQTKGDTARWKGGHKATTLLLDPAFDGCSKWFYQAHVSIRWKHKYNDYLFTPLEGFSNPPGYAGKLLDTVEKQLIYYYQPQFNKLHKKIPEENPAVTTDIHLQEDVPALRDGHPFHGIVPFGTKASSYSP